MAKIKLLCRSECKRGELGIVTTLSHFRPFRDIRSPTLQKLQFCTA